MAPGIKMVKSRNHNTTDKIHTALGNIERETLFSSNACTLCYYYLLTYTYTIFDVDRRRKKLFYYATSRLLNDFSYCTVTLQAQKKTWVPFNY